MLDKADLRLYEEVARMPPFQRKTLVLIGTEGIGRRTLKTKLLNLDPDRFGATIPRKHLINKYSMIHQILSCQKALDLEGYHLIILTRSYRVNQVLDNNI